jgi:hypothetical protein
MEVPRVDIWEDLERRVRERGIRVEERLGILRLLREGERGQDTIGRERERLLAAVAAAGRRLLDEAIGR